MIYRKTTRRNPRKAPVLSLKDASMAYITKGAHRGTVCNIVRRHGHTWYALQFHVDGGLGFKMFHASYLRAATLEDVK